MERYREKKKEGKIEFSTYLVLFEKQIIKIVLK